MVSHDCHLDKEFNREVTRLHREGVPRREARERAEEDRTLDRWIVVSPVLTPEEVRSDLAAVRRGEVVGSFYVPHHDVLGGDGAADLSAKATVDRLLCRRAAGMTEAAADALRIALMRADLARRPIGIGELEHVLGAKLIDVTVDAVAPNPRHPALRQRRDARRDPTAARGRRRRNRAHRALRSLGSQARQGASSCDGRKPRVGRSSRLARAAGALQGATAARPARKVAAEGRFRRATCARPVRAATRRGAAPRCARRPRPA